MIEIGPNLKELLEGVATILGVVAIWYFFLR